jgi:hypothetical protein
MVAYESFPPSELSYAGLQGSRERNPSVEFSQEHLWPDDLPTGLIHRLQAHEEGRRRNERLANRRNSRNIFDCPFCRSKTKEFAQFRVFIRHLKAEHYV